METSYPFIKCLNPRSIVNPYTGEHLVVPCGSCPACVMRKSAMNAMKCKLESLSHKYSMFITLTYNNVSLPRMIVKATNRYKDECGEVCDTYEAFNLIDITQRLGTEGTILGRTSNWSILESLSKKVELPHGILPHLSKYDIQLFMKRFRRNLEKYYERKFGTKVPKVRYYAVGEYGPVHFRPHYHLILWFSEDEIYKVIRQILHQSWSFGRIDCEKSQGQCADYVAKYLNCSQPLPLVFKEFGTRPFSLHSSHLGEEILKVSRSQVYENEFTATFKRSFLELGSDSEFTLWRSLKTYYFPKCKGYSQKSKSECRYSYLTYEAARTFTKETRISEQADIITEWILRFHFNNFTESLENLIVPHEALQLIKYFEESARVDLYNVEKHDFKYYVDTIYRAIYMELRLSKHFIEFVCDGNLCAVTSKMKLIDDFWKWNDLENLNNSLRQQEEYFLSDWFESETECRFFYYNRGFDIDDFKQTKAYKKFIQCTTTNFEHSVKHKRLNDLNKVFDNK